VSFRNIPPMEPVIKGEKRAVGVVVAETSGPAAEAGRPAAGASSPVGDGSGGAKLLIETAAPGGGKAGGLGSLSKIRQKFADRSQDTEAGSGESLGIEALHRAWQQYADYLRENRNPAVQSLELATLRIIDAHSFEVVTNNNLEQKFIEQEKRGLSDHLQQVFANKAISFTVLVEEKVFPEEPADRPLNKREQFIQIVDQYPLVKELKDRLRLELDY
jgi:DNA polymerase-3 subunit gamma/tau